MLKARLVPKFPARVLGGTGMSVTKSGGVYTFSQDIAGLTEKVSITEAEADNLFFVVYDSDNTNFRKVDIDTLLTLIDSGLDATLVAIGGLAPTADQGIYFTGADTAAVYSLTASGRALAGLSGVADRLPFFDGTGTADVTVFTALGRSLVAAATAAAGATVLGVGTGDSPQFTAIELGHATDTTIARVSAGVVSVEGSNILLASGLGSITQAYDAGLAALAVYNTNGILVQTADNTFAGRTLTGTAGLVTVTNGDGVSGNPTVTVADAAEYTLLVRAGSGTGAPAFAKISAITDRAGFGAGDKMLIEESTGELRKIDYNDLPGAGSLGGSTGATDNSALRADGTGGATVQASPLIIADTTGDLSRSGGGGIDIEGTNTNDSAGAGYVGEYVSGSVASGSAVSLTSTIAANLMAGISLTAGDWDVDLILYFVPSGTTNVTNVTGGISTTTATLDFTEGRFHAWNQPAGVPNGTMTTVLSPVRLSLSGTTTVYPIARANFTVSTMTVYGVIRARRVR